MTHFRPSVPHDNFLKKIVARAGYFQIYFFKKKKKDKIFYTAGDIYIHFIFSELWRSQVIEDEEEEKALEVKCQRV